MALSLATRALLRKLRIDADRLAPRVQAEIEQALAQLQASVSTEKLAMAIARRDQFALHDLAGTLPLRLRPALATLSNVFASGFAASIQQVARQAARTKAGATTPGMSFAGVNAYAQEAALRSGARLVREVTNETRVAIRTVVSQAFAQGIPPREAAQLIRPLVGLTRRQALSAARVYGDAIADGASRSVARGLAREAAVRLRTRRSRLIARTEIIRASSEGQIAGWRFAQQMGNLGPRAKKIWIVTPDDRLCPYCRAMDGETAFIGADFVGTFGEAVSGPPLHPACRCAIGLTFDLGRKAA